GVPAHHLWVEQTGLFVDPLQVILRRDAERRRAHPTDGPAEGNRERHVAQLPEVLREPERVDVVVRGHALLALAGRELRNVRLVERVREATGIEDRVGTGAR